MSFIRDFKKDLELLKFKVPNATYQQKVDRIQQDALFIFQKDWNKLNEIKVHIKGTAFQIKVWETLLKIPQGSLTTYGIVAKEINHPRA